MEMEYEEQIRIIDRKIERKEEIISRLQDKITEIKGGTISPGDRERGFRGRRKAV